MSDARSSRPQPNSRVLIDPNNAYDRLGVSPLDDTEEIGTIIRQRRNEIKTRRGARGDQRFGKEEEELTELQRIEDEIGVPKKRLAYDLANPQNELLTVQPSPDDQYLAPKRRAALVSAWLVEELGDSVLLPSADCLGLWAPGGVDAELLQALKPFEDTSAAERSKQQDAAEEHVAAPEASRLEIGELKVRT